MGDPADASNEFDSSARTWNWWTGLAVVSGKRGAVPKHLAPILERVGLLPQSWCTLIVNFGSLFRRAVGRSPSMDAEATRRGQLWMHGGAALG